MPIHVLQHSVFAFGHAVHKSGSELQLTAFVGVAVGATVGKAVGEDVGARVGAVVGAFVGAAVGAGVGSPVLHSLASSK